MLGTITRSPLQIRLNDSHKVSVLVTTLPYPVALHVCSIAWLNGHESFSATGYGSVVTKTLTL